jgi:hypothetical protein
LRRQFVARLELVAVHAIEDPLSRSGLPPISMQRSRNCAPSGDAINAILAAAGYNFSSNMLVIRI